MLKEYNAPIIEIIRFQTEDVMVDSNWNNEPAETPFDPTSQESDYPVFFDK